MPERLADESPHKPIGDPTKILRYFSYGLYTITAFLLVILVFLSWSFVRLALFGSDGQATVVDMRTDTYKAGRTYGGGSGVLFRLETRTDHYVTYVFSVDGENYQRERRVSEGLFKQLSKHSSIPVRYIPNAPTVNEIDPEWVGWGIIIPLILAMSFGASGYLFQRASRVDPHRKKHNSPPESGHLAE